MTAWAQPPIRTLAAAPLLALALCACDPQPSPSPAPATAPQGPQPPPTPSPTPSAPPLAVATPLALPVAPPPPGPVPTPAAQPAAAPSAPAADHPAAPTPARYAPQDECTREPGFAAFRKTLVSAIRARDAQALAALAAPDIRLDYGGGSGTEELKRRLGSTDGPLWQELDAILPLGCAMQSGLAAMPWVFWNVPDRIDSYSAMLVLGDDTPLLDKAGGTGARTIETIGWGIVGIDPLGFDPKARFTRVTLNAGTKGWVATASLRSLLDYRLIAEPRGGRWRITAFIAGD